MVNFDGNEYTETSAIEELLLIERHARDGSAYIAGCGCIEEKHLLTLAGLASEMCTLTENQAEKEYYMQLAEWARTKRKEIIEGKWNLVAHNGMTACEKKHSKEIGICFEKGTPLSVCKSEAGCT